MSILRIVQCDVCLKTGVADAQSLPLGWDYSAADGLHVCLECRKAYTTWCAVRRKAQLAQATAKGQA